jgi:hypothetical protein
MKERNLKNREYTSGVTYDNRNTKENNLKNTRLPMGKLDVEFLISTGHKFLTLQPCPLCNQKIEDTEKLQ